MSAYVSTTILPHPGDTTARVHPLPGTITVLAMGGAAVQFGTPEEALDWLVECTALVAAALLAHGSRGLPVPDPAGDETHVGGAA